MPTLGILFAEFLNLSHLEKLSANFCDELVLNKEAIGLRAQLSM